MYLDVLPNFIHEARPAPSSSLRLFGPITRTFVFNVYCARLASLKKQMVTGGTTIHPTIP